MLPRCSAKLSFGFVSCQCCQAINPGPLFSLEISVQQIYCGRRTLHGSGSKKERTGDYKNEYENYTRITPELLLVRCSYTISVEKLEFFCNPASEATRKHLTSTTIKFGREACGDFEVRLSVTVAGFGAERSGFNHEVKRVSGSEGVPAS
jgi:hypothetical protein